MNYQKIYDALCARGNARLMAGEKKIAGYEDHHIVPRSMGGTNDKANIARLTVREHFLAHWLFMKANPHIASAAKAVWFMRHAQQKRYTKALTSRGYAALKVKLHPIFSEQLGTINNSDAKREQSSTIRRRLNADADMQAKATAGWRARWESDAEFRDLRRRKNKDRFKDDNFRKRHAEMLSSRNKSEKQKFAVGAAKRKRILCAELSLEFESLTLAVAYLKTIGIANPSAGSISLCANGKRLKSAYGYTWKYI